MKKRIIARLDIKNEYVIKGIHLEGLRKVGNPNELAKKYYEQGIDEIIFMDAVAAYYDRNSLSKIIKEASKDIFVPITVGGGIRKIEDIQEALNAGADKVSINTQAIRNPEFIKDSSKVFGSQCIVSSIVAKRIAPNRWEAFVENGREPTGINVIEWAKKVETLGAGEIMLTSIDKEGTKKGFDLELNAAVSSVVTIPLIASGGAGKEKDIVDVLHIQGINAIALASTLHYNLVQVDSLKKSLFEQEIEVRV